MVVSLSSSRVVDVSIARAYEVWSDLARLPTFMRNAERVRVEGGRLRWQMRQAELDALAAELIPDNKSSADGLLAVVNMSPLERGRTKITLGVHYAAPPGNTDSNAAGYEQLLPRFKAYVEETAGRPPRPDGPARAN